MKKLIISLCFGVAVMFQAKANDADLFSYDQSAVTAAVSELSSIESYVSQNYTLSVNEMASSNALISNLNTTINPFFLGSGEPPLGIPSFLWGCGLGVVGILLVYIMTDNDKEQTKKAVWGCVTSTAVYIVIYVVIIATAVSTASTVSTTTTY
jgi:hypothetical protein